MKLTVRQLFEALQRADKQRQDSQKEELLYAKRRLLEAARDGQDDTAGLHQTSQEPSRYNVASCATTLLQGLFAGCQLEVEITPEMAASITPFVTKPAQGGTLDEKGK